MVTQGNQDVSQAAPAEESTSTVAANDVKKSIAVHDDLLAGSGSASTPPSDSSRNGKELDRTASGEPPQSPEVETSGLVLPGDVMVEQLAGRKLLLVGTDTRQEGVALQYGGVRYTAFRLPDGWDEALALPDSSMEFESLEKLQQDIVEALLAMTPLAREDAELVSYFTFASWMPGSLPAPAVLNLWGPASPDGGLTTVLGYLCRRPLTLADLSFSQFGRLPQGLDPTLFLTHPSEKDLRRLRDLTAQRGVLYRDGWISLRSSMVVTTARPLHLAALRLGPAATERPYPRLRPEQVGRVRQLQRQLLHYRLTRHAGVARSQFDAPGFAPATRCVARILGACFEGEPALQDRLVHALEEADEAAKATAAQGPEAVVLESLLSLIHEGAKAPLITEIGARTNAILLARRQALELSVPKVGKILREDLGLPTSRESKGVVVVLKDAAAGTIHLSARSRGVLSLLKLRENCRYCDDLADTTNNPATVQAGALAASPTFATSDTHAAGSEPSTPGTVSTASTSTTLDAAATSETCSAETTIGANHGV